MIIVWNASPNVMLLITKITSLQREVKKTCLVRQKKFLGDFLVSGLMIKSKNVARGNRLLREETGLLVLQKPHILTSIKSGKLVLLYKNKTDNFVQRIKTKSRGTSEIKLNQLKNSFSVQTFWESLGNFLNHGDSPDYHEKRIMWATSSEIHISADILTDKNDKFKFSYPGCHDDRTTSSKREKFFCKETWEQRRW